MSALKAALKQKQNPAQFSTRDGDPNPADFDDKSKAMEKIRERIEEIAKGAASTASEAAVLTCTS